MEKEIDLYSDYQLSRFGRVTAVGLSGLPNGVLSHDRITRMLSRGQLPIQKTCGKGETFGKGIRK